MNIEQDENDDLDEGPEVLQQPRFSLNMEREDEEDDSFDYPPPRMSVPLEDENITQKSVEMPRRATGEQPLGRYSRASFGSIRLSDYFDESSRLYSAAPKVPTNDDSVPLETQNGGREFQDDSRFDIG